MCDAMRRVLRHGPGAIAAIAWLAATLVWPLGASAQTSQNRELQAAYQAAFAAMVPGPGTVKIADEATIRIGGDDGFVPRPQAVRLMHAMGNAAGESMQGLVLSRNGRWNWFIAVEFEPLGFAPPADIARLDKDAIFDHIRRATLRGNAHRSELGDSSIDVAGFVEPPSYDAKLDRMFMATRLVQSGPSDGREDSVNLDAYVFGRDGVLTLGLATSVSGYANLRRHMDLVYYGAAFVPGKRSSDAEPSDKRIEYLPEILFGGQTAEEVAKEKGAAADLAKRRENVAAAAEDDDRNWYAYLIAGAGSLTLSGIAAFFMMRMSAA